MNTPGILIWKSAYFTRGTSAKCYGSKVKDSVVLFTISFLKFITMNRKLEIRKNTAGVYIDRYRCMENFNLYEHS